MPPNADLPTTLPDNEWFIIEPGIEIRRPSRIEVSVVLEDRGPKTVRVAGGVVPVMRGALMLPYRHVYAEVPT